MDTVTWMCVRDSGRGAAPQQADNRPESAHGHNGEFITGPRGRDRPDRAVSDAVRMYILFSIQQAGCPRRRRQRGTIPALGGRGKGAG